MKRRSVLLFDLISGADAERHPVVRFRIVAFEGGEPPDFLPEWVEVDRLDVVVDWGTMFWSEMEPHITGEDGQHLFEPRRTAGAIHGFIERYSTNRLGRIYASIAWDSPGRIKPLRALFAMYDKRFPWRLTKVQLPDGVIEQVKL